MAVGSSFMTRGGEGGPPSNNKPATDEQLANANANANQVHLASELQKERAGRTGGQVCVCVCVCVCVRACVCV
jgi:hypothetical protein